MSTFAATWVILLAMALWTAPWFISGRKTLGWLFLALDLAVGGAEIYEVARNGQTISQQFGVWGAANPHEMVALVAAVSVGFVLFALHMIGSAAKRSKR